MVSRASSLLGLVVVVALLAPSACGQIAQDGTAPSPSPSASGTNPPIPPSSGDAYLRSLVVVGGTLSPSFAPTLPEYNATIPPWLAGAELVAIPEDPKAGFTIDGAQGKSGIPGPRALVASAGGHTDIQVGVTAENGATFQYTVRASRAEAAAITAADASAFLYFGATVALSRDGGTLAAFGYAAPGPDGSLPSEGAVYVFRRSGAAWVLESAVQAPAPENVSFGDAIALSADGNVLAVGESHAMNGAGAVYLFARPGPGTFTATRRVQASNAPLSTWFGSSVALSDDGKTLAVGAFGEASRATTVGGDQNDTSAPDAGAVYVFRDVGEGFAQEAYVKGAHETAGGFFGRSVALSGDGSTLAVGQNGDRPGEVDAKKVGGGAYIFRHTMQGWSEDAYLQAGNSRPGAYFGVSVALSLAGDTLAVGSSLETSGATGVDGNADDSSANAAGAAYVFSNAGPVWAQDAYIKASNTHASATFGVSVALSSDGKTLVVGSDGEASVSGSIDGAGTDTGAPGAGAAYAFTKGGALWSQASYLKAKTPAAAARFGKSVSLSGDGTTLAVGAAKSGPGGEVYVF